MPRTTCVRIFCNYDYLRWSALSCLLCVGGGIVQPGGANASRSWSLVRLAARNRSGRSLVTGDDGGAPARSAMVVGTFAVPTSPGDGTHVGSKAGECKARSGYHGHRRRIVDNEHRSNGRFSSPAWWCFADDVDGGCCVLASVMFLSLRLGGRNGVANDYIEPISLSHVSLLASAKARAVPVAFAAAPTQSERPFEHNVFGSSFKDDGSIVESVASRAAR